MRTKKERKKEEREGRFRANDPPIQPSSKSKLYEQGRAEESPEERGSTWFGGKVIERRRDPRRREAREFLEIDVGALVLTESWAHGGS